ncbi:MAG TPA: alpha/beta fold hydrolase [Spirochaetota bacterium]|nr:alpha/beta fold hydrolase [Spirochaetota bacterium]
MESSESIKLKYEPVFISVNDTDTLHMMRIYGNPGAQPVLMIHGAVENGRIFYNEKGKGLAPYLAMNGFDVYAADLRGRGASLPHVSKESRYGQTESITEDIPAFIEKIREIRGNKNIHMVCHSWGGVLTTSFLVRFPENIKRIKSIVYFGSKRRVSVYNLHRLVFIDLVWRHLFTLTGKILGYVPAKKFGIGIDNESRGSHSGCVFWVEEKGWVDPVDRFNYGEAACKVTLPPALYFAAENDRSLGHPSDVIDFINESGSHRHEYRLLSRKNGNMHNYDHVSMITHRDAVIDHFPEVLEWLSG